MHEPPQCSRQDLVRIRCEGGGASTVPAQFAPSAIEPQLGILKGSRARGLVHAEEQQRNDGAVFDPQPLIAPALRGIAWQVEPPDLCQVALRGEQQMNDLTSMGLKARAAA